MFGPIYDREFAVLPRRLNHFIGRGVFAGVLFALVCTAWLLLAGIQPVQNLGDLSRFGTLVFQFLAPVQLVILGFMAALAGANAVAHEKDRRTLILLLLTSLSNPEVVLGKIVGGMLPTLNLFFAGLPVLMLLTLLGGVSAEQVLGCGLLTFATIMASASLGATVAFWREKTFQAIAITLLAIVLWLGFWEAVATGFIQGVQPAWASVGSPLRAIYEICKPIPTLDWNGVPGGVAILSASMMTGVAFILSLLSIIFLRVWNPSREARPTNAEDDSESAAAADAAEKSSLEVGADGKRKVQSWKSRSARKVWDRPILWREMCTWAYGRKILFVRVAYLAFFLASAFALQQMVASGAALSRSSLSQELIPDATKPLAPFLIVSLVIINALAVNSVTNERDGQALDFLLITEISPAEFVFSKIFGALYVAKEMVLLPFALCGYLWWQGGLTTENFVFVVLGLIVMDVFVTMLGIHCGMIYSQSRNAIAVSLGTVFFLFLGIITCLLIMISFRGSFGKQLAPFLAIILGGGAGLYMALGNRNPSPAITLAAFSLPFLTFFSITSFLLRNQELTVFSVISFAYGFATTAMLIPALSEFDFAMGRSRTPDDEPYSQ